MNTVSYGDSTQLLYLRARYYNPADGRFISRDTWGGDTNSPMSFNRWMYVEGNPINLTDTSGHNPSSGPNPCEGKPDYKICYARWVIDNGGKLSSDIIESIYGLYPDETLELLQQQFDIKIPSGYSFRYSLGGSAISDSIAQGVGWWFAESNPVVGELFEISEDRCGLFSTDTPSQATHMDYSIYIFKNAFTSSHFNPDNIAGTMIHEAMHAWQEYTARDFVRNPGAPGDPSSLDFKNYYSLGMEYQANSYVLDEDKKGRVNLSWWFRTLIGALRNDQTIRNDFPYPLKGTP